MGSWIGEQMGSWDGLGELGKIPRPPPASDLADESIRKARAKTLLSESLGRGTKSTFLTGSRGDLSPVKTKLGT